MSKVWLACLALLVAVCGGYFALVPFLQAIEPTPQFGAPARVASRTSSVDVIALQTKTARDQHRLVSNQLRAKKPKHKTAPKHKRPVTVPTKPVFVNHPLRPRTPVAPRHTATPAPTRTHSTPTPTRTHSAPTHQTPINRDRVPVTGSSSSQGSGLAGRGGSAGSTVTGGVTSSPAHP
jgi:hypothetical protein